MQGMSDLLAPILVEIPDEAEAFWCFVDIIKRGLFVCAPTDSDMEKNLVNIKLILQHLWLLIYKSFFNNIIYNVLVISEGINPYYATSVLQLFRITHRQYGFTILSSMATAVSILIYLLIIIYFFVV